VHIQGGTIIKEKNKTLQNKILKRKKSGSSSEKHGGRDTKRKKMRGGKTSSTKWPLGQEGGGKTGENQRVMGYR